MFSVVRLTCHVLLIGRVFLIVMCARCHACTCLHKLAFVLRVSREVLLTFHP